MLYQIVKTIRVIVNSLTNSSMKKNIVIVLNGLLLLMVINSCEESIAEPINSDDDPIDLQNYTMENSCYTVVVGESPVDNVSSKQLQIDCPEGSRALGAGWSVLDNTGAILDGQATYFQPSYDGSGWLTNATNQSGFASEWKLRVRLTCLCEDSL